MLSGFLLSSLLLEEHRRSGAINVVDFAKRRARRIVPALSVLLAALAVLVPLVAAADAYRVRSDVAWSVVGLTNWHLIADGSSYFSRFGSPSFARHLWSVAVEIQFYVVCPFLVAWLAKRRRAVAIAFLGAGIAASATASALLYRAGDPSRAYYGTDARAGALLVGVLLAVILVNRVPSEKPPTGREGALSLVAVATLLALMVVVGERSRFLYPTGFLLTEAVTALLIVLALRPGWLSEVLAVNELQWLGKRSYGIYLWFWPLVVLVRPGTRADWPALPAAVVTIGGAVVLGALSYRFVETRFIGSTPRQPQARRSFSLRWVPLAALMVLAAVMLSQVSTTNQLSVALRAGQRVLTTEPAPTTTSTLLPSTAPPETAAPDTLPPDAPSPDTAPRLSAAAVADPVEAAPQPAPEVPAAPAAVPQGVPITAIGDSVMVIASQALSDRLGSGAYIDAKQNRQFSQGIQIAQRMHDEGSLGRVLIVHLGNNGPVEPDDVETLMAVVADVPHVLLVTVRCDAPWQDSVNDALRAAAAAHPTIQLVDWYSYSAGHDEWFQHDGTHFRADSGPGNDAYGDLIAAAIPAGA
ncbi:MAG: acyltransferase [Actinomycetota bacterium]|nr:acyltransferase [Actinomycetota bacterium]